MSLSPESRATQDAYREYRSLLFGLAYRMLGEASEAEDIVQEAYLRYSAAAPGDIRSPKAFLTTIVTNLCLDYLKSARVQREQYIGPWLPEPVSTASDELSPLQSLEQRESVSMAFLVLLERLTPQERALFLLREVFEYGYSEIARMLSISAENCRQIAHRAKMRLAESRPRFEPSPDEQRRLTERFLVASKQGNMEALTQLLAQDVAIWSDGGGKVAAARRPIFGKENVVRFIVGLLSKAPDNFRADFEEINGAPAIVSWLGTSLLSAITLEVGEGSIKGIRVVANPDKLAYLARQISSPDKGRSVTESAT